jgi:ribosome biogenesis GTPase A
MFITARLFREFRQEFNYDRVINWFPGHMAKGLRLIQQRMNETDILIEVRDSRIPLSSMNPKFEKLISQSKERIVVFNKMDLIQSESIQVSIFRIVLNLY